MFVIYNVYMKFIRKCTDQCEVFLQETSNSCHYSCLRCEEHGFIKWLSYDQHRELADIIEPVDQVTAMPDHK